MVTRRGHKKQYKYYGGPKGGVVGIIVRLFFACVIGHLVQKSQSFDAGRVFLGLGSTAVVDKAWTIAATMNVGVSLYGAEVVECWICVFRKTSGGDGPVSYNIFSFSYTDQPTTGTRFPK